MAGPNYVLDKSFVTTAAVRKFRFVKGGASEDRILEADTAGGAVLGVCQEEVSAADGALNRPVDVRLIGISRCISGGTCTLWGRATVDNQGRVVDAATGNRVVGIFMQGSTAAGDHIDVLLQVPTLNLP